ncbi:MAG: MMPL family transporter, partial [Pseudomonadota bacterium]
RMFSGRRGAAALALSAALLAAGALSLPLVAFNYDFDSLSGSNEELRQVRAKQGMVYTETLTPGGVVFAPDEAAARSILSLYQDRMKQPGSVIDRVLSICTFIPADQERRLLELERIGAYLTPGLLRTVKDPEVRRELEQMKQAGGLRPLTPSDLPLSVREMFVLQDEGAAFPVYLYGRERMTNGRAAMLFQAQVGGVSIGGRTYIPTGGALIYASVLRRVVKQGPWIFMASLLFIVAVVTVQFKKLVKGVLALLPLLTGLALMVMIMAASPIDLNMYNVAILAAIVGLGVDYGIHFLAYYEDLPASLPRPERASRSLHELFRPLLFSWLTTSAGYTGLVISHHPGLRSIGVLALIGLTCCFVMSITLLPMLLAAVIGRKPRSSPVGLPAGFITKAPGAVPHRAVPSFLAAKGTLFSSDMIYLR